MAQDKNEDNLDDVLDSLQSKYGEGAVMKLGDQQKVEVDTISSGSFSLDLALGVGGLPKGRVIEIYGPEASGKTTLALHAIAEAQKEGGKAAFIDAEHALDPEYAGNIGVDVDNLVVSQPDSGDEALNILESLVESGAFDIVVVDSVAALTPKEEIEGEMGDKHVGLQARLMSQALRKLTSITSKTGTAVIFINQIRMKVGVRYGNPETTSGGRALKFYSSVRLDIRRKAKIKKDNEVIGNRTRVKVVKNKVAPPFKVAKFDIFYGKGIAYESDLLTVASQHEVVERAGSYYKYEGENIGQGKRKAMKTLQENEELLEEIEEKTLKAVGELPEEGKENEEIQEEESEDDEKDEDE
ncbi:MAG: recombinase RecA [Candidatus Magasanikbacteria bacterium]